MGPGCFPATPLSETRQATFQVRYICVPCSVSDGLALWQQELSLLHVCVYFMNKLSHCNSKHMFDGHTKASTSVPVDRLISIFLFIRCGDICLRHATVPVHCCTFFLFIRVGFCVVCTVSGLMLLTKFSDFTCIILSLLLQFHKIYFLIRFVFR